jgi:hypothetical protein
MSDILFKITMPAGGVFIEVSKARIDELTTEQRQFLTRKFFLEDLKKYTHVVHAVSYLKRGAKVEEINKSLDEMFDFLAGSVQKTDLFLLSHFLAWQLFDLYNVKLLVHGGEVMHKFAKVKNLTLSQVTLFNRFGYTSRPTSSPDVSAVLAKDALSRFVYHIAPDLLNMIAYEALAINSDKAIQKFVQNSGDKMYLRWIVTRIAKLDNSFATKVLTDHIFKTILRAEETENNQHLAFMGDKDLVQKSEK